MTWDLEWRLPNDVVPFVMMDKVYEEYLGKKMNFNSLRFTFWTEPMALSQFFTRRRRSNMFIDN